MNTPISPRRAVKKADSSTKPRVEEEETFVWLVRMWRAGSSVAKIPSTKSIRVRDQEYRVIGVFARQGSFLGIFSWDSQVVIPLASYIRYFKSNQENASIRVKVRDKNRIAEAKEELRGRISAYPRALARAAGQFRH